MVGRRGRHGAASCLVALATLALQHRAASGTQIRARKPFGQSKIPFTVWVTGEWAEDAPEIQRIGRNIGVKGRSMGQRLAQLRFRKWVPIGSKIHYLTDADMAESARNISKMLKKEGVTDDAFKAFSKLRPAAYRADLWRYMALWAYGGVYLDANIKLRAPIQRWVNFNAPRLVLVDDAYAPSCGYWNAMMASPKNSPWLEILIKYMVDRIQHHVYGDGPLDVTGPTAMCKAFKTMGSSLTGLFKKWYLTCDLRKEGMPAQVVLRRGKRRFLMAVKDEGLHHFGADTHYEPMWQGHAVYCDEMEDASKKPGLCGTEGP